MWLLKSWLFSLALPTLREGTAARLLLKSKACPSCQARRMMDLSIHLVEKVLPKVPYRQWTIAFPRPIRFTFFEDLKTCTCGGVMGLIAAISCAQTQVITKILQHLDIPVDISEPLPARLPSQLSLEWEEVEWVKHEEFSQVAEGRDASRGPP